MSQSSSRRTNQHASSSAAREKKYIDTHRAWFGSEDQGKDDSLHWTKLASGMGTKQNPTGMSAFKMEVLRIRPCMKADLPEIMKIERATSDETGISAYSEEMMPTLLKYTDVIDVNGVLGGFCTHHMLTHTIMKEMKRVGFDYARDKKKGRCADTMYITNIAVRKELRGMGYGKRLVKTAVGKHPKHKYARYTCVGDVTHCIEKVLRALSYTPTDDVVKESTYANGKDALLIVFRRPA